MRVLAQKENTRPLMYCKPLEDAEKQNKKQKAKTKQNKPPPLKPETKTKNKQKKQGTRNMALLINSGPGSQDADSELHYFSFHLQSWHHTLLMIKFCSTCHFHCYAFQELF